MDAPPPRREEGKESKSPPPAAQEENGEDGSQGMHVADGQDERDDDVEEGRAVTTNDAASSVSASTTDLSSVEARRKRKLKELLSTGTPWYAIPRARFQWGEKQGHAHVVWGTLFFDLEPKQPGGPGVFFVRTPLAKLKPAAE